MILNGFVCEGPRCTKGTAGRPVVIQWDAAQTNPLAMPNEFFRFIVAKQVYEEPGPNDQGQQQPKEHQFCSSGCLRDYFNEQHYIPARSPREQAEQAEINSKAEADKVGLRDGFGKPRVLGSKVIPFRRPTSEASILPVDQADGGGNDDPSPILA